MSDIDANEQKSIRLKIEEIVAAHPDVDISFSSQRREIKELKISRSADRDDDQAYGDDLSEQENLFPDLPKGGYKKKAFDHMGKIGMVIQPVSYNFKSSAFMVRTFGAIPIDESAKENRLDLVNPPNTTKIEIMNPMLSRIASPLSLGPVDVFMHRTERRGDKSYRFFQESPFAEALILRTLLRGLTHPD